MAPRTWSFVVARWSVAALGALLVAGAGSHVAREPDTLISLLEVGLALVVGLGLVAGGYWLQATHPARRVARVAVWSLLGVVVGFAALVWFAFVISLEYSLVGDPVVVALNGVAIVTTVFTILGYYATRLRHRERKLVQSRSRFRALTENSPFAVITADETGTIQYANDAVEDLFGYEPGELVGEPMADLFREPPAEVERGALADDVPSGAHAFEWSRGELTAVRADGGEFPVRISFGEYFDGSTRLFTGIVLDISERREAETRLREHSAKVTRLHAIATRITRAETESAIYRGAVDGAVDLFDCDGAALFLDRNDRFVRAASTGTVLTDPRDERRSSAVALEESYRSGDVVRIGDADDTRSSSTPGTDGSRHPPEGTSAASLDGRDSTRDGDDAHEGGQGDTAGEADVRAERPGDDGSRDAGGPDDRLLPRSIMSVPLDGIGVLQVFDAEPGAFTDDDEEVAELLGTHVITAHDRVAAETSIRRERDRLEEFASVLSHDIRNPLTVAEGRLHLAREADDPEEHLEAIDRAHERIDRLIEDVLTLAKQGQEVGTTETVPLETAAKEAWETVATDDATLRIVDDLEVEADRTRLLQLLENLYRNAIAHGGEDVPVTVGGLEGGFYVEDTGPGVPPADRERVFESGYSTDPDGTGFGLAIVDRIAEAHGWSVTLAEAEAGGARFEITGVDGGRR